MEKSSTLAEEDAVGEVARDLLEGDQALLRWEEGVKAPLVGLKVKAGATIGVAGVVLHPVSGVEKEEDGMAEGCRAAKVRALYPC